MWGDEPVHAGKRPLVAHLEEQRVEYAHEGVAASEGGLGAK